MRSLLEPQQCYVGKNRLDLAIAEHKTANPADTFTTTWAPFYLNPDAPKQSVDKQQMYERKFGAQRTQMMQVRLAQIGKQVGIDFAFGGRTGNTRDSHRLIQLAKTKGERAQTRVVEQLFKAYFETERDITDHRVLLEAAVAGGLDETEAKQWLDSDKGGPEVDREVSSAQRKFISGVPNFTVNGKYEVQGAEEPAAFLDIFQRIKASGDASNGVTSSGNTC
ncbi:hypothetical protein MBLNU459_g1475t1 [Dothideomycetes sp. NU459]